MLHEAITKSDRVLNYETLMINQQTQQAFINSSRLDLTDMEFNLLSCFLRYPGRPMDREELARQVWGTAEGGTSNFVDVTVMQLRRKMEGGGQLRLIHAVRGRGYVLHKNGIIEGA